MKHNPLQRLANHLHLLFVTTFLLASRGTFADEPGAPPLPIPMTETSRFIDAIEAHMGYVTEYAIDEYGEIKTAMWLSTIDISTAKLPQTALDTNDDLSKADLRERVSNLYWDQPTLLAAHELGRRTGCKCYPDAASASVRAFLNAHSNAQVPQLALQLDRPYDVVRDAFVPKMKSERAAGTRYAPAWETLWVVDAGETERAILSMVGIGEVGSASTKAATKAAMHEFSQRSQLIESASWLVSKKVDSAKQLRRFVKSLVDEDSSRLQNGLQVSDAEIGTRAEALLRASRYLGNRTYEAIATSLIRGRLSADTDSASDADVDIDHCIETLPYAEAIVSLWEQSGDRVFQLAAITHAERLVRCAQLSRESPLNAEGYGRAIHFLVRSSQSLEQSSYREQAFRLSEEAMQSLYEPKQGMFRSRVGSDLCRSSDGPGFLILALLYLDGPDATTASPLHF